MAGPLDGIDLGAPSPNAKKPAPAAPPSGTDATGPLSGIDLSAPSPAAPAAAPPPPGYQSPSWLPGAGFLHKLSNIYDDAATAGLADTATAKVGDLMRSIGVANATPDVNTLRAQTQQNRTDVGPVASALTDVAGYTTGGVGKLGIGEGIATRLGGGYVPRIIGATAEGAGASALGTAGHGDTDVGDLLKSAAEGGAFSAVTGAIPGAKGANADIPRPTTSDLESTASGLYAPLKNKVYQTPDVEKAINSVSVPQGMQANMSKRLSEQIDRVKSIVAQGGQTTANDIAGFRRSLLGAATNDTDMTIAGQYVSALEKGVGPKTAADIGAANAASNVAKTSDDIDNWITQAQRNPGRVPDAVNSAITNNPGFYKSVMPQLQDVANTGAGVGSKLWEAVKKPVIGAVIDAGANYVAGQSPLAGAITGGLTGAIMGHGEGQARTNALVNKLAAARHFNATGQKLSPASFAKGIPVAGPLVTYAPKVPAALGASGAFMPNQ